jgi:hypothetical protein
VAAVADTVVGLAFAVEGASVAERTVAPALALDVRVERVGGGPVRAIGLQAQVRIAAPRRGYDAATQARLRELFGPPEDWGRTLHGLLWAQASAMVGPFAGATAVTLALPCSYDLDVAAAKYLDALRDGAIPLDLQFSGTVFAAAPDGRLQVTRIPSDCEASFALPVALWREAMERTFGEAPWLRLRRDVFDRLYAYRAGRSLGSWEATVEALLDD